jgi:hypothetical protein
MHGKGIKRRQSMLPSDWKTRDMCLVLVWEIPEANRYENLDIFPEVSVAIDLHERSILIAPGIITN